MFYLVVVNSKKKNQKLLFQVKIQLNFRKVRKKNVKKINFKKSKFAQPKKSSADGEKSGEMPLLSTKTILWLKIIDKHDLKILTDVQEKNNQILKDNSILQVKKRKFFCTCL